MNDRVVYRGKTHVFKQSFFDSSGDPLVPVDDSYPRYSVYDIDGNETEVGTGVVTPVPGIYSARFITTDSSPLSTNENSWRIEWLFIDDSNAVYHEIEDFDLLDEVISASEDTSQQFIFLANKDNRLTLRLFIKPFSMNFTIFNKDGTPTSAENVKFPGTDIKFVRDGDSYIFYYVLKANSLIEGQSYSAMWEIFEDVDSNPDHTWQKIVALHWKTLRLIPDVRMLIDKVQKKHGTIQAYSDADLANYAEQGLGLLNAWYPLTNYNYAAIHDSLIIFWLLFSSWYGLNAQFLLETDIAFSFGGQTTSLDYDRTGGIESELSRLHEFISEHLTKAKQSLIRSTSLGTVSVRPYRGCQPVFRSPAVNRELARDLSSILGWW